MDPLLGVFLVGSGILLIGFRPRKPWIIHAYMNKMFIKVFLVVDLAAGAMLWWMGISAGLGMNRNAGFVIVLLIVGLMCLIMVYVLYWGLPFSRKQKGVAAVDAAIERYKKQEEGVVGTWQPDLIVDGKAYSVATYYTQRKETGILGVDLQGKVVRDLALMNKIAACSRLAQEVANPEQINARTKSYRDTQKMLELLDKGLAGFDRSVAVLGEKEAKRIQTLKQTLLLIREYSQALCEMWYLEAEWGSKHGNAHLKEVRFEDVLDLNGKMKAFELITAQAELLREGISSAASLLKLIQKEPVIHSKSPDLKPLMELISGFERSAQTIESAKETGTQHVKYMGLSEQDHENWQSRLAWVDKVNKTTA
jgi:hypothetical protein